MNTQERLDAYDTCEKQYPELKAEWDGLRRNAINKRIDELDIKLDLSDGYPYGRQYSIELGTLRAQLERIDK